jgi:hypothetical protein
MQVPNANAWRLIRFLERDLLHFRGDGSDQRTWSDLCRFLCSHQFVSRNNRGVSSMSRRFLSTVCVASLSFGSLAFGQDDNRSQADQRESRPEPAQSSSIPQPQPDPTLNDPVLNDPARNDSARNDSARNDSAPSNGDVQGNWSGQPFATPAVGMPSYGHSGDFHSFVQPVSNRVYTLRYDAWGREFICVNGQRIYFDNRPASMGQPMQDGQRYQAGFGSYDQESNANQSNQGQAQQQQDPQQQQRQQQQEQQQQEQQQQRADQQNEARDSGDDPSTATQQNRSQDAGTAESDSDGSDN